MKFIIPILLIGLMPLLIDAGCNKNAEYDYYALTMTLPSTFCAKNPCKPKIKTGQTRFMLHGLWPNRWDRKTVDNCCGEDYRMMSHQLTPIRKRLANYWTTMRDDNLDALWNYEWKKHGSCATATPQLKGVKNYFTTVLKLVEELDLDNTMRKLDFTPNDSISVIKDSKRLQDELWRFYDAKPKIRCIRTSQTTAALEQIQFCYDKSLKMIDCDGSLMCSRNMFIPTFRSK